VSTDLSRTLHQITTRMGQTADRVLRDTEGITYRRYQFLYAMDQLGVATQRDLARWMGVTEPSVSRMVRTLIDAGWLESDDVAGDGNRRQLHLSATGEQMVRRCGRRLAGRFADVVAKAGVPYDEFHAAASRILDELTNPTATGRRRAGSSPASRPTSGAPAR
jgi:DNA-binding MarR family transcriptional regulator